MDIKEILQTTPEAWSKQHGLMLDYVKRSWDCGYSLLSRTKSYSNHPLETTYYMMIERCYNPKASDYAIYGQKGITVCARWYYSFDLFVEDMGERPKNHTLDRIDYNGIYEPKNCRWATHHTQMMNRKTKSEEFDMRNIKIDHRTGKFKVSMYRHGKEIYLGVFEDIVLARQCRNEFLINEQNSGTDNIVFA